MATPRRSANREIRKLRENLAYLNISAQPTGRTRVTIRRYYAATNGGPLENLLKKFSFFFIPALMLRIYVVIVQAMINGLTENSSTLNKFAPVHLTFEEAWQRITKSNPITFSLRIAIALSIVAFCLASIFIVATIFRVTVEACWTYLWNARYQRFALLYSIASAIDRAAEVRRLGTGTPKQQEAIRSLSVKLELVYRDIASITRWNRSLTRPSHRRAPLKNHHLKVITALQTLEKDIDKGAGPALSALAEQLLRVANSYSDGRIGQLLPSAEVDSLEAAKTRDFEPARMVLTALMLTSVATVVAFLHLPDAAVTSIVGASGVIAVTTIYGAKARNGMDVLDSVRGIQRP